MKKYSLIS